MSLESSVQFIDLEARGNEEADEVDKSNEKSSTSGITIPSEINIKDLTIKLLTSPENLDFALQHQADKVLDLQDKVSQLQSMSSTCLDTKQIKTGDSSPNFLATQTKSNQDNSSTKQESTAVPRNLYQHITPSSSFPYHSRSNRRPRSAAYRVKNRPRPRYIQLPPSFKYPEPIDIRPARGYNAVHNDRKDKTLNDLHTQALVRPLQRAPTTNQANPVNNQVNVTDYGHTEFPRVTGGVSTDIGNSTRVLGAVQSAPDLAWSVREGGQISQKIEAKDMLPPGTNNNHIDMNLNLSQRVGLNLPSSIMESNFKTASSAARSMFELVVGDRQGLNSNLADRTFWGNKGSDPTSDAAVPRSPHKRFCPKHAGRGSDLRFQCVCPGTRAGRHWSQTKGSHIGARFPTPFMHWKNAIELSRARRCRTKIEPDMLDLLEMKYTESHFVSPYERKSLAEKLGITERAVIYWFQNRRRKDIKNLNNMGQPPHGV